MWDGADGSEQIGLLTLLGSSSQASPKAVFLFFQVDLLRTNGPMTIWKMKPKPRFSEPVRQGAGNIKVEHSCLGAAVRTGRSDSPCDMLQHGKLEMGHPHVFLKSLYQPKLSLGQVLSNQLPNNSPL